MSMLSRSTSILSQACMAWLPGKVLHSILFLQGSNFGSSLKNNLKKKRKHGNIFTYKNNLLHGTYGMTSEPIIYAM